MDIRQFRDELAQAFEGAGFQRKPVPRGKDPKWLLPGREVERLFSQQAMRRPWGFRLSGVFTIDVPAFREWLTKSFPQDEQGVLRDCLSSWHIANDPGMFFGVEDETPPYEQWVQQISRRLAVVPDTIGGLLRAEKEDISGLGMFLDEPRVWDYFRAWAEGAEPRNPPPHRLPTGQIVDTPANDAS